jgi:hypothetical protein
LSKATVKLAAQGPSRYGPWKGHLQCEVETKFALSHFKMFCEILSLFVKSFCFLQKWPAKIAKMKDFFAKIIAKINNSLLHFIIKKANFASSF